MPGSQGGVMTGIDNVRNATDMMKWCRDKGIPTLMHGGEVNHAFERKNAGWVLRTGGKVYRTRIIYPHYMVGDRSRDEHGKSFEVVSGDTYLSGWRFFAEAGEHAERLGLVMPWKMARGTYLGGCWVPADTKIPGVRWWPPGLPCEKMVMGDFMQSHMCGRVRAEGGELCAMHTNAVTRRHANAVAFNAKADAANEARERRNELIKAAQDTCDEVNAALLELMDISLDAEPNRGNPGDVSIDHEKVLAMVRRMVG